MRFSPILPVAAAVAAAALSASPAVAGVSALGERDNHQAVAEVAGRGPHSPHGTPTPTPTPTPTLRPTPTPTPTSTATGTATPSRVAASASGQPSSAATGTASPPRVLTATPGAARPRSTPAHAGTFPAPAGTITGDSNAGGSGAGEAGTAIGVLGGLLAAAAGGVLWRQLRKKRRFKTTWLPPVTVPLGQRNQLPLPPAADPFADQAEGGPQQQAPWEQPTLVDLRWAQSVPSAEDPVPGQDPQQRFSQVRSQALPPVENPFLDGDRGPWRVQHPPGVVNTAPLDIVPPENPVTGRLAARQPRPAQAKRRKPQ